MVRYIGTALVSALILWPLTGCGAIFNGTTQTIRAQSSPQGATITTSPETGTFTTPASLELERSNSYVLTFSQEGYSEETFQIRRTMNGGILVLDILAGLIGVIVDAATGAWYNLSPEDVSVTLEQQNASVAGPEQIYVTVTDQGDGDFVIESSEPGVNVDVLAR